LSAKEGNILNEEVYRRKQVCNACSEEKRMLRGGYAVRGLQKLNMPKGRCSKILRERRSGP